jgi:L-ascorbate metabolism protein UlaG (beta-lactamase superfamily)
MSAGLAAAIVSFLLFSWNDFARAQPSGKRADASLAWNDSSLIPVLKNGGSPTRAGDVRIEFYGHDAFKITSPAGLTVLTDPWRNDPTGVYPKWFAREFPAIPVDIVLSTHAHFDHDAVERPKGRMVLERLVGRFQLGDIEITGLADKHNEMDFDNSIEVIETGGLRIAVWGDNRAAPDPFVDHYLKNVDVLFLPVDTVLTRAEADAIVEKYKPKAVIPCHYAVAGLTTGVSGLAPADGWVNYREKAHHADVRRLASADLTLHAGELKEPPDRIYYFGNHIKEN